MFLSFFSIYQLLNELLYILNNNLEVEKLTFNDFKLLKCKFDFFQVLFVVGENASQCRSDDLEDLRERMKVATGLVMVGGADDLLRVSTNKKKLEGVTQSMVDRSVNIIQK